ncbi:STAS domain-containing protein [Allokutzneria sp. A3M-2-11 16]|uniref:STAS domain-containing protein n=1 Tax=Allokutzneria sp. A3M-2-11 16 TaxID=2962043 RepID=UPI0020B7E503|nr:STAS domain-containing protein [Allokutzneria sp. A3M-2-11 16]MCP3805135.1 STAS domain-containing protein [Allokutzneria sp. A3M-2-11 16]
MTSRAMPPRTVVVAAVGEVDMSSAPLLRTCLHEEIRPHGPNLVADLTGLVFFGAAGITVLAITLRHAGAAGIRFSVIASSETVVNPLRITGMLSVIDVYSELGRIPARETAPPSAPE